MAEAEQAEASWAFGTSGDVTGEMLAQLNTWWRAANYLSLGQIYLLDTRCSAAH